MAQGLERLRHLPFEDLGFARVDHHCSLCRGFPEVIFTGGKEIGQLKAILTSLAAGAEHILGPATWRP